MKQRQMISPLWDLFRDKHNKRVSQCRSGTSCVVATQTHARQGRLRHYIYIYIYLFYFIFIFVFSFFSRYCHRASTSFWDSLKTLGLLFLAMATFATFAGASADYL